MSVVDFVKDLWRQESDSVVHGWLEDSVPSSPGDHYVKVTCVGFGLKWEKDRLKDRAPVFVSQIDWPNGDEQIQVTRTLGPTSFQGLHEGGFATMVFSNVGLSDALPLNQGSIDVRVALLSQPQSGLLDEAASFINDLADLTLVPQLTAAAPVATKIATGVDKLLGNNKARGLIALMTSVSFSSPRAGYYVVSSLKTSEGWKLEHLRVNAGGLEQNTTSGWRPLSGEDYLLVRIELLGPQKKRWRSIDPITDLWTNARAALRAAESEDDVRKAGRLALAAMYRASEDENLTVDDRVAAESEIEREWAKEVKRRVKVLKPKESGTSANDAETIPSGAVKVKKVLLAGARVSNEMQVMRRARTIE